MAGIIEKISDINKRVGALESKDLDDAAGVAKIMKQYNSIKFTPVLRIVAEQFATPDDGLVCDDDTWLNEINLI